MQLSNTRKIHLFFLHGGNTKPPGKALQNGIVEVKEEVRHCLDGLISHALWCFGLKLTEYYHRAIHSYVYIVK